MAVGSVMRPAVPGPDAGVVTTTTKVRDVVPQVAASELPVSVVDESGVVVGSIDRVTVLSVIAGEDLVPAAGR